MRHGSHFWYAKTELLATTSFETMRISMTQHDGTRMRQQIVLVVAVFLGMLTIWQVRSARNLNNSVTGFDNVNAADEENFEGALGGGINTVSLSELPADSFGETPMYNPSKPDLIFHVGPLKTGVEELSKELRKYQSDLRTDRFEILKSLDGFHESCQKELSYVRQQFNSLSEKAKSKTRPLQESIRSVPCWKSVLNALKSFRSKRSVLISDSHLSNQFLQDVFQVGPATLDWISVRDTLMADWNIVIVVSYLRYYEWLPAAKAATEQLHLVQHSSLPPRLARWPGDREKGMLLEPLFPHFIRNAAEKLDIPYTARTIDMYRPYVPRTKVLNMYTQNQSIATTFLCDVLDSAKTACESSRKNDALKVDEDETALVGPRTTILNTTGDITWYDFQLYDELVTTAAERGLIRSKRVTRTTATATTQYYVEKYLKLEARQSLPLTCPPPEQWRRFLDESLAYERSLLGIDIFKANVRNHRQEFQSMIDNKMFCSINMRAVLRQQHWRTFFRHLTNLSAQRIQAGGKPGPLNRKWYVRS
jgi:hypothetical protein